MVSMFLVNLTCDIEVKNFSPDGSLDQWRIRLTAREHGHNQNNLAYPKVPTSLGHLVGRGLDYVRYTEIRMRDSNGRITKVHDLAGRHLSDVFSWMNLH